MKILLHCCCAPCSVMPLKLLREAGHELSTYFYNPNIHPYTEYKKRRNCFREYMESLHVPFAMLDDYDLAGWLALLHRKLTQPEVPGRCGICYSVRLRQTAAMAAEHGFAGFSTSLLVSPYQQHDLIRLWGERAAAEFGLQFVYQDFRPYFREGQKIARAEGLYMQKYCGCIYSEKDRYFKPKQQPLIFDNKWQKRLNQAAKEQKMG